MSRSSAPKSHPGATVSGLRERLSESYWLLPSLMVLGAAILAFVLAEYDEENRTSWLSSLPWLKNAGPDGSRAVLTTISGSMIAVAGTVFSIMIVALTLASNQFGHRLLRNFLRDRSTQFVLGTFIATFLYSLLVTNFLEGDRVPYLATTMAVLLAILSIGVLVFFLHHAATSIQANSVIAAVYREAETCIRTRYEIAPEGVDPSPDPTNGDEGTGEGWTETTLRSRRVGYLRGIASDHLLDLATRNDLVLAVDRRVGDFVSHGSVLVRVRWQKPVDDSVLEAIRSGFVVGAREVAINDLRFFVGQLVDIAVRALSPGTNDPRTAVVCVHRIGALLCQLAPAAFPDRRLADTGGRLRVVPRPFDFPDLLREALDGIRYYGIGDVTVVAALLRALRDARAVCPAGNRRAVLAAYADEVLAAFEAVNKHVPREVDDMRRLHRSVVADGA